MAIEVQPTAVNQSVSGQPVTTVEPEVDMASGSVTDANAVADGEIVGGEANAATVPAVTADGAAPTVEKTTPVTVDIGPEALRQITSLSATNRKLKQQIAELTAKATPTDVTEKLAQLAALQNETPRQYLKRTGKTLEEVAADALIEDAEVSDPRVDKLQPIVDELKATIEELKTGRQSETAAQEAADNTARLEAATTHVQATLTAKPERWSLIQGAAGIAAEVVKAAIMVVERDYKKPDGTYKPIDQATSQSILEDCLDQAEIFEAAKKLQEDKKKALPAGESLVKRKGLEVLADAAYTPDKGSDGKQANGARTPKVTIDGNRGAIRQGAVKRGPTDVRTARARMLRVAGATDKDTD